MDMPKVSVIIPNYNHARFLERRIGSVLEQTYRDLEVVYMDDASTDDSNKVFARYAGDERIRAIYNEANSGSTFKQWNKGVTAAQGEYIWIAESDDYADLSLLERLVHELDANPNVGVAYCQSWKVDENQRILGSLSEWTKDLSEQHWAEDFVTAGADECRNYLLFKNTIPNASAVLFRKSLFRSVGGADEKMRLCGDWLFWVKLLLRADVAFVSEPLNYFRTHAHTVRAGSERTGTEIKEHYEIVGHILRETEVQPHTAARSLDQLMHKWLDFNRRSFRKSGLQWKLNVQILRIGRRVDARLVRRCLRLTPAYLPDSAFARFFIKRVLPVFGGLGRPA